MQKLTNFFVGKNITFFFYFGVKRTILNKKKNRVHSVLNYNNAYLQLEQNQLSSGGFTTPEARSLVHQGYKFTLN